MNIFAGLMNPGNPALAFQEGMQRGRAEREDREVRGALSAYAMNPEDEGAFQSLAQYRPEMAIQIRNMRDANARGAQQAQREQQEQRRADLPMLGRLLGSVQDEQTFQQARAVAQEYGIDLTGVPDTYGDGAWVSQTKQFVDLLSSERGQEALSNAGKQAMDMGFRPGTPEYQQTVTSLVEAGLAQPYTGSQGETRLYTPTIARQAQQRPSPSQDAVLELLQNPDSAAEYDEVFGPGEAAKVFAARQGFGQFVEQRGQR